MGALDEYRAKRDFSATPEPEAGAAPEPAGGPRFVIQRHDARALHFDLRLEVDGALASWAVPKGVPLREGVKRLAVRTEDHPLEYLDFSAVIPAGQYGAGRMTIWDRGSYVLEKRDDQEWKLVLEGGLLRGNYHLVRTDRGERREEWLLFRSTAGPPGPPDPLSRYRSLRPMLAGTAEQPFDDPAWAFELKWDGYRSLAFVGPEGVELRSRRGLDVTATYPLGDLRRAIMCQEAVLDGELVVLDEEGRPRFSDLQAGRGQVSYAVFDLLYCDGEWIEELPWSERRRRLAEVVSPEAPPRMFLSDHVVGQGVALYAGAHEQGLEGVVAKRVDAPYRPGRRTADWRKVKSRKEMVAVIGGFVEGQGGRKGTLGALLVGEPGDGGLVYVCHVGSGFTAAAADQLWRRLLRMETKEPPFLGPVPPNPGSGPLRWVRPELRCEVSFAERTADGSLRAPVFEGLVEEVPSGPPPGPFGDSDGDRTLAEGERQIRLTNLGKVYWPGEGITKGHLLDHYLRVAPYLVPHVAGRPMILKRYPGGIEEEFFFQHNLPDEAPSWLRRVELSRSGRDGQKLSRYAVIDDPLGLLWLVNLGCIDINPWQSLADSPDLPTHVLFDLDPADGLPFAKVVETALLVREALTALGLRGHPRTSGATGMHIMVPLQPGPTYETVRLFARVVAEGLVRARPDLVTTRTQVAERGPRVYLDANQNGRGRSIASVYSVRPRPGAPVATPLHWDEVGPGLDPREHTIATTPARLEREGDLSAGMREDLQSLDEAVARLGAAG